MFSTGDITELTGIDAVTINKWANAGYLGKVEGGEGRGNHRSYSFMQAFAVAAGALYRSEGAWLDRIIGVVQFLSGRSREQLEADFANKRKFPVPATMFDSPSGRVIPGLMVKEPDATDAGTAALVKRLDLEKLYREFGSKAAKLKQRQQGPREPGSRGRRRGSVTNI